MYPDLGTSPPDAGAEYGFEEPLRFSPTHGEGTSLA
jgi:hypothetical protein